MRRNSPAITSQHVNTDKDNTKTSEICSVLHFLAFTGRAFLWGNYTLWNHKNSSHMALPRSSLKKSAEDMEDTWSYRLMGIMEVDSCCIWLATLYQRWRFRLTVASNWIHRQAATLFERDVEAAWVIEDLEEGQGLHPPPACPRLSHSIG